MLAPDPVGCPHCGCPPTVNVYPGGKAYVSQSRWRCGTRRMSSGEIDISRMCHWTFERFSDYERQLRAAQRRPWWRWWR